MTHSKVDKKAAWAYFGGAVSCLLNTLITVPKGEAQSLTSLRNTRFPFESCSHAVTSKVLEQMQYYTETPCAHCRCFFFCFVCLFACLFLCLFYSAICFSLKKNVFVVVVVVVCFSFCFCFFVLFFSGVGSVHRDYHDRENGGRGL